MKRSALTLAFLLFSGCGEDPELNLEPTRFALDNKLSIEASFCTDDPNAISAPVKVLFLVDASNSMQVVDPNLARIDAMHDFIDRWLPSPDVSFALTSFAGSSRLLTGGFTRDRVKLESSLVQIARSDAGPSNWLVALDAAERLLSTSITGVSDIESRRTKFIIVFITDGLPQIDSPENNRSGLLEKVRNLTAFASRIDPPEVAFHTVLLGTNNPHASFCYDQELEGDVPECNMQSDVAGCEQHGACRWYSIHEAASVLLGQMAEAGNGNFSPFAPDDISFGVLDASPAKPFFRMKRLLATNLNAAPRIDISFGDPVQMRAVSDTDADGLSDAKEAEIGTDPEKSDSDGDGYSDLLEMKRAWSDGLDPIDPHDADCSSQTDRADDDRDGLLNCEERLLGTDSDAVDSDRDGIPDLFELRSEANPLDPSEESDLDFDSVSDIQEILEHSDPTQKESFRNDTAYRYQIKTLNVLDLPANDGRVERLHAGAICYEVTVENITLAQTAGEGKNTIQIIASQEVSDDETAATRFHVACIDQIYREPDLREPNTATHKISWTAFRSYADTECP